MEHPSNSSKRPRNSGVSYLETIIHGITGWIIAGKTDEINQQEHHRKTKIYLTVTLQIEPQPECNGNRYPTEIEYPGKESQQDNGSKQNTHKG